jgi:hypothetical protein
LSNGSREYWNGGILEKGENGRMIFTAGTQSDI